MGLADTARHVIFCLVIGYHVKGCCFTQEARVQIALFDVASNSNVCEAVPPRVHARVAKAGAALAAAHRGRSGLTSSRTSSENRNSLSW
jgi:hypothetical protein